MKDHFAKLLGPDGATENKNDLLAYSYDASGMQGKARVVLFPKNTEHIRQILTYANRTNIPVVVRGLGANPLGMVVPDNAIVVDMAGFDRVHTLNLKDGWVHVEAGVVLDDLALLLESNDKTFPINPITRKTATIGALLAMNQMDRASHKHGRLKDHVLSLEIVDGTGKHFPEARKDFIGMEGTSAIIISAKIKIYSPPETLTTTKYDFKNVIDLLAKVEEEKKNLAARSMEYLNPKIAHGLGIGKMHTLLVEYDDESGEVVGEEAQHKLWNGRDNAWEYTARHGHPVIGDCHVSTEKCFDVIEWCDEHDVPLVGHIGMGILHPFLTPDLDKDFTEFVAKIGAVSGQFGYGKKKKRWAPKPLISAHTKLKDEYDYNDILNRGVLHDHH